MNSAHSDRDPRGDFLVPTNQITAVLGQPRLRCNETRNFDIKLIEEVKNVPALWDSRVEEYKHADRKRCHVGPDCRHLGSSAGITEKDAQGKCCPVRSIGLVGLRA